MRYYVSWKTIGYYRKDSLKLAARCPVSGCWPSCLESGSQWIHCSTKPTMDYIIDAEFDVVLISLVLTIVFIQYTVKSTTAISY